MLSKTLKNTGKVVFFSKVTGNSPKILQKLNSYISIFQGFQTTELTEQLLLKIPIFRGSAQLAFTCSHSTVETLEQDVQSIQSQQ